MSVPQLAVDDRTRDRILDAAGTLLVRVPRSSLSEVAAAAGVGRTTVHRHFPTREDLLDALAIRATHRIATAVAEVDLRHGSASEALRGLLAAMLPLTDEFGFVAGNEAWELPELQQAADVFDAQLAAVVERGKTAGEIRADLPTALIVDVFGGLVWSVGCSIADGRVAARSAADDLTRMLFTGIGA